MGRSEVFGMNMMRTVTMKEIRRSASDTTIEIQDGLAKFQSTDHQVDSPRIHLLPNHL